LPFLFNLELSLISIISDSLKTLKDRGDNLYPDCLLLLKRSLFIYNCYARFNLFFSLEIMSSIVSTSGGIIQPELLGPKLIVLVKRLREKVIEELTSGIWRCDSCGKTEKSFLMMDLHFDTGFEKLSPIECDVCPAVVCDYREFVPHFMEHQMGETRRWPICLCEYIDDIKQHLIIKGHFSPSSSELDLLGNSLPVVSQNLSTNGCSNSHESEAKSLENREVFSNSQLLSKNRTKLKRHSRANTGKKLKNCDVGKKRFSHSSNLIGHQRVHTGEKSFKCDNQAV